MDIAADRKKYETNVKKIMGVYFFSIATREISFGALFDSYLMNLGGEKGNILVGSVESLRGLLQMILAYPLGMLADRMSRVRLIRYNVPFWTTGLIVLMLGIQTDTKWMIYVGMCLWAPCMQCFFSGSSAVVADSCPPETRTSTLANMSNVALMGGALGPLLQIIFLTSTGSNHWEMPALHKVIAIGCLLWPLSMIGTYALEELPPLEKTSARGRGRFHTEDLDRTVRGLRVRWWLAISMQISETFTAVGAGMTVKFFPLFFRFEYGFEPIHLCLLTFSYPLVLAVMQRVCLRVAASMGRLKAIILFHFLGTACLFAFCALKPLHLVLPLYYLRGALMNSSGPVIGAVLMDLVTSEMRGRWSSIQSIAGFSWSGSAFIGGWVAQSAGYRASFAVTASVYTFSGLLLIPLLFVFPKEREAEALTKQVTPEPLVRDFVTPVQAIGVLADSGVPLLDEAIDEVVHIISPKTDKDTPLLSA